jgi:tetratricopeptide (TPR) repeat protein
LDFDFATSQGVEAQLWDAHSLINNRYRKIVNRYKSDSSKKHVVEKRKWEKRYADFLKTSQYYYKGYIQRLASNFAGMIELRKIAHRLSLETLTADPLVKVSEETAHRILMSCHSTLLRLGDLYRYRNNINTKDRSWEKANAHYGLANDLYPDSGSAFNQMAVISLSDGNHLDAVYNLYRALAVKEPHPLAEGNITIEFKKIISLWKEREEGMIPPPTNPTASLVQCFVYLHAELYKGEDFAKHDDLESEVLSQMGCLLKEHALEGTLDKMVLINIAAEYFAIEKFKEHQRDKDMKTFFLFLRLNIQILFMLLQILQPELDITGSDDNTPDVTGKTKEQPREYITAVTRRILPALRQYSTWLVKNAHILVSQVGASMINVHIKEMWSMYCSTLTLMVAAFPPQDLPYIDYLLAEDAATVGFKPFRESLECNLYTDESGNLKARTTDPSVERHHPNIEMAARIRDLLRDGMVLATNDEVPVYCQNGEFRFFEDGPPPCSPVMIEHSNSMAPRVADAENAPNANAMHQTAIFRGIDNHRASSVAASDSYQSMSTEMYRMVDDLVTNTKSQRTRETAATPPSSIVPGNVTASGESSYGMHNSTALEVFGSVMQNSQPHAHRETTPAFPSIPTIYSTPFSPQPGELGNRVSSLKLNDKRVDYASAAELDQMTGPYSTTQMNSWNRQNNVPISLSQRRQRPDISHQSQQSVADQFPASSEFTHPSSLYQNTPSFGFANRYGGAPYTESHSTSTAYAGANDFDRSAMLQSSIWVGCQPARPVPGSTPPAGQMS